MQLENHGELFMLYASFTPYLQCYYQLVYEENLYITILNRKWIHVMGQSFGQAFIVSIRKERILSITGNTHIVFQVFFPSFLALWFKVDTFLKFVFYFCNFESFIHIRQEFHLLEWL